jgi:hypothetical protein
LTVEKICEAIHAREHELIEKLGADEECGSLSNKTRHHKSIDSTF